MPRTGRGGGPIRTTLTQYARQRKAEEIRREAEERDFARQRRAYSRGMRTYERQLADLEPERYLRLVDAGELTPDPDLVRLAQERLR